MMEETGTRMAAVALRECAKLLLKVSNDNRALLPGGQLGLMRVVLLLWPERVRQLDKLHESRLSVVLRSIPSTVPEVGHCEHGEAYSG